MPKTLLIAEAANPEWASVPLVGWSLAKAILERTDAHLVTQVRNEGAIRRAGLGDDQVTFVDSERVARPAHAVGDALRLGWTGKTAAAALAYPYFEHLAWRRFGGEVRAGGYDVVHRITPLTPTAPSPMAPKVRAAGAHFVMGPINGGVPWPAAFDAERRRAREWLSYVRGAYKALPGRGATLDAASLVWCGSRHTQAELPAAARAKSAWLPENAVDPDRFARRNEPYTDGEPLRLVFLGRLVPYKGCDMAIRAAAPLLREGRATLDVVGDGPEMGALRALAEREGVADAVTFRGWVEHAAVQDRLAAAHVLAFPSVREFGGGVVLEAMATGVVPAVADYAGPGELVDDAVGVKVAMGAKDEIVAALGGALRALADDPARVRRLREAGLARVAERYTWARKAERVIEGYEALRRGERLAAA